MRCKYVSSPLLIIIHFRSAAQEVHFSVDWFAVLHQYLKWVCRQCLFSMVMMWILRLLSLHCFIPNTYLDILLHLKGNVFIFLTNSMLVLCFFSYVLQSWLPFTNIIIIYTSWHKTCKCLFLLYFCLWQC